MRKLLFEHKDLAQSVKEGHYAVYRVKSVGDRLPEVHAPTGEVQKAEEGTVLRYGDRLYSHDAYVELRGALGELYRLGPGSDFSIVPVPMIGFTPVYEGRVLIITANGKYRTSCYIPKITGAYIEKARENLDAFYALMEDLLVFEYDEAGEYFEIIRVTRGNRAYLRHHPDRRMRDRYEVVALERIPDEKIAEILDTYINPLRW